MELFLLITIGGGLTGLLGGAYYILLRVCDDEDD